MESEWMIEIGSCYSTLGDNWVGSEIYANIGGEMAEICSVHLVMTQREHFRLRKIEDEYSKGLYSVSSSSGKKRWWQKKGSTESEFDRKIRHEKYMQDREELYKRPELLHDKYLSIILSAQSAVNLLTEYKETGVIDAERLERVLAIARGDIAPTFKYAGQICSCGHEATSHATQYLWDKNGAGCTEEDCDCKCFVHATDIVGVISTVSLRELREREGK